MRRFRLPGYLTIAIMALTAVLVVPQATHAADVRSANVRSANVRSAELTSANVTSAHATAASGGLCSVPGIGDIGGLLGFCALGSSGLTGELNNVCQPSLPTPEPANGGIDSMVAPPSAGKQPSTLYDDYGVAGDFWAATNLQCSDMTSLIGNNVAGMVFDAAKSIDRVTITVYQSAAGPGIVSWLQRVADKLITSLGNAIYFPYLAVVVIIAAIWLAWQGLIRKRGTRTIEGTIWMIAACAAALFLIGKPADVTGVGAGVSNGISQALNAAFAKLPSPGPSSCVPVQKGDPQVQPSTYSYTSGSTVVDQNADELWTVLVCKPWLVGEFGTSEYATGSGKPTLVNTYGRSLLWAQAIAANEKPTTALIQAKQSAYAGIASSIQANDPAVYPLFQGNQWTTRLEVGFAALFAAIVAGVLVLLIAVTLILLKLSFLLLLIVGPFFLLIGTHPGFGRVVALRWVELLVGVLLKQAAVALVLSLLLYCYALIMGTSDAVLPWALKILMISLVTVAAFIYRKPFQHLFSAVGYGMIGSQDRAEADLARAGATARAGTSALATAAVPGFAAYRAARWARRNPGQAARLAMAATSGGVGGAVAAGVQAGEGATDADGNPTSEGTAAAAGAAAGPGSGLDGTGGRVALAARARAAAGGATTSAGAASGSKPPPLNLPPRNGSAAGHAAVAGTAAGGPAPARGSSVPPPAPGAWPLGRGAVPGPRPASAGPASTAPGSTAPVSAAPASAPAAASPQAQPRGRAPQRARPPGLLLRGQGSPRQAPQGQSSRAQPSQRQPPERQPSQRQPPERQPSRGQPSLRQAPQRQSSRSQPSQRQPTQRQSPQRLPAQGQTERSPRRPAEGTPGAGRQATGRPGQASGEPDGARSQPSGPLAGPDVGSEAPVPFWLRPVRRR
jgi:TrbL/VirB6 plasmid conjugal transfer protein